MTIIREKEAVREDGVKTIVLRCKECPFVVMGTTRFNWTCDKTKEKVPLSEVASGCPLPAWESPPDARQPA